MEAIAAVALIGGMFWFLTFGAVSLRERADKINDRRRRICLDNENHRRMHNQMMACRNPMPPLGSLEPTPFGRLAGDI